jgi:hypothetical protein
MKQDGPTTSKVNRRKQGKKWTAAGEIPGSAADFPKRCYK